MIPPFPSSDFQPAYITVFEVSFLVDRVELIHVFNPLCKIMFQLGIQIIFI